jgi:hypothetical protein
MKGRILLDRCRTIDHSSSRVTGCCGSSGRGGGGHLRAAVASAWRTPVCAATAAVEVMCVWRRGGGGRRRAATAAMEVSCAAAAATATEGSCAWRSRACGGDGGLLQVQRLRQRWPWRSRACCSGGDGVEVEDAGVRQRRPCRCRLVRAAATEDSCVYKSRACGDGGLRCEKLLVRDQRFWALV